jgi:hypothetical protein
MDSSPARRVLPETTPPPAPRDALMQAARLSDQARRSTRWYGRYLLVFAAGSFVVSVLTGAVPGPYGVLVTTLLWAAFLLVTTLWIARKKTAIRGMTRLHLPVMVCWGLVWTANVLVGEHYFADRVGWWVLGGIAIALPPVVGAVVAFRRTA